ncbi:hypothetical protein [Pseudarthrobacter oxydans]|uniref:hypothetical protein n=1 Tax=Pseudarthrobacter oxydans TaxID=1671 RepID=UPI00344F331D
MKRPYLKPKLYTWKAEDKTETPGVALMNGTQIRAHMTYTEARTLADRIHDLCDANGTPEAPLPTTPAEQE